MKLYRTVKTSSLVKSIWDGLFILYEIGRKWPLSAVDKFCNERRKSR